MRLTQGCCRFRVPEPVRQVGERMRLCFPLSTGTCGRALGGGGRPELSLGPCPAWALGSAVLPQAASASYTPYWGHWEHQLMSARVAEWPATPPPSPSVPDLPSWPGREPPSSAGEAPAGL